MKLKERSTIEENDLSDWIKPPGRWRIDPPGIPVPDDEIAMAWCMTRMRKFGSKWQNGVIFPIFERGNE